MKTVKTMMIMGIIGIMGIIMSILVGCDDVAPKADQIIQKQQENAMREAVAQTGLPAIKNFQEKKMLKALYELRDQEDLICHAYLFNAMTGEVGQYLGKCIGYGLPASTQYSNPRKTIDGCRSLGYCSSAAGILSVPQAEPNGLFMPDGLSATWLMMVDPTTGKPRPVYIEPLIIVSPFELR